MKLGNLMQIISGPVQKRIISQDGYGDKVRVISNSAIKNGILVDKSFAIEFVDRGLISYSKFTTIGDIVMKLSAPYDMGVVKVSHEGCINTSVSALLRVKPNAPVIPAYVALYMNSVYFKNQLASIPKGTRIAILKLKDIAELDIDVPSIEIQHKLVAAKNNLDEKLLLYNKAIELENEYLDAMLSEVLDYDR